MRKTVFLLFAFCAAFMSCTEKIETDSVEPQTKSVNRITATIEEPILDDGAVTRTTFDNDKSIFVWAEKDTIGIFPNTGDQVSFPIE